MTRQILFGAVLFSLSISSMCQETSKPPREIFEATVVRVEPWGPIKISCGIAIVYRMAEYRVDLVYRGHLHPTERIAVRYLACSGDELNDLTIGDKVIVFANKLEKPVKRQWMTYKGASETREKCPNDSAEGCFEVRFPPGESVMVRYSGEKLAKLIYPTTPPLK